MSQPPAFINKEFPNHVCRLNRALYGLKQAPREWYRRLSTFLERIGFVNSQADFSLFIRRFGLQCVYGLVYVDDFIITGSHPAEIKSFKRTVCNEFQCLYLGSLSYFLGLEANIANGNLLITQRKYSMGLLQRFGLVESKPMATHEALGKHLSKDGGELFDDPQRYRSLVGALQYLTLSRPDIAHAVNQVCKYMQHPTADHWKAAKRILRYIKGTLHMGLEFRSSKSTDLQVYVDSDWAGDPDDGGRRQGPAFFLDQIWSPGCRISNPRCRDLRRRPNTGLLPMRLQNSVGYANYYENWEFTYRGRF